MKEMNVKEGIQDLKLDARWKASEPEGTAKTDKRVVSIRLEYVEFEYVCIKMMTLKKFVWNNKFKLHIILFIKVYKHISELKDNFTILYLNYLYPCYLCLA